VVDNGGRVVAVLLVGGFGVRFLTRLATPTRPSSAEPRTEVGLPSAKRALNWSTPLFGAGTTPSPLRERELVLIALVDSDIIRILDWSVGAGSRASHELFLVDESRRRRARAGRLSGIISCRTAPSSKNARRWLGQRLKAIRAVVRQITKDQSRRFFFEDARAKPVVRAQDRLSICSY
jgi:hypothetical protein